VVGGIDKACSKDVDNNATMSDNVEKEIGALALRGEELQDAA
jgi:hypothetical protein